MKLAVLALWCGLSASALVAQQFKLDFVRLEAKASDTVDVSLPGPLLHLGAGFLDPNKPDEAAIRKLITGLEAIYVRHFEFKANGVWTQSDLDSVHAELKAPEWTRLFGWKDDAGGNAEVFMRLEGGKMTGVAIIDAEPKEFTVVNIVGAVDLEALAELGGHFGVPKLEKDKPEKDKSQKDKTSKKQ